MRSRPIITAALVAGTAALSAIPASGAATKAARVTKVTTTLELYAQGAPNPSGIQFGFAHSSKPLGEGVHYDSYTVTPTSMGHGTIAGSLRNYYARGTTSGTFALTFAATSPTDIAYDGTIKITGGSGAFRRVTGTGTIHCTTSDGGAHKACTTHAKLTGV